MAINILGGGGNGRNAHREESGPKEAGFDDSETDNGIELIEITIG